MKAKQRIKQNVWGNWYGYEGRRRTEDFGNDEQSAKEWLADPIKYAREKRENLEAVGVRIRPKYKFSREWAMPSSDTFSIAPIGNFVRRYLHESRVSIDPFARNKQWATHTNDLNPDTAAKHHIDAEDFLKMLAASDVKADLVIFDPPYSPRQISECYKSAGLEVGMKETQSALLYQRVRNAIVPLLTDNAVVLSFGWNTVGMGKKHGFEIIEILLCCHGGAHNDTICLAERRVLRPRTMELPLA